MRPASRARVRNLWSVFTRYYLGVVLIALAVMLLVMQATGFLVARSEQRYAEAELRGTFHLIEHHLQDHPADTWNRQLDHLREFFAYPVKLLPLAEATRALPESESHRLREGSIVLARDGRTLAYKRLGHGTLALVLGNLNEVTLPDNRRLRLDEIYLTTQVSGTLALIRQRFDATPVEQWPKVANHLSAQFAYPVTLLGWKQAEAELDAARRQRLEAGQVVAVADRGTYLAYRRLAGGRQVIRLGPLDDMKIWGLRLDSVDMLTTIVLTALVLLGIALPLFVAIHRVWRDLHAIGAIAERLSAGDLHARHHGGRDTTSLVRPLAEALNRMAARNQRLIEGQRILTTAVSHEIRTPLARMRFALEMLPPAEERDNSLLEGLEQDVARLEQITRAGLSYARLGWQPVPSLETVPVDALFYAVAEQAPAPSHLGFECTHPPGLFLQGDREALLLALRNLVVNAFRHARCRVRLEAVRRADGVTIYVDDDGPGVPPECRDDLFLPFRRQAADDEGLGLGLALVRVVADRHGASSEFLASPWGGARVRLHFPQRAIAAPSNSVNDSDKA